MNESAGATAAGRVAERVAAAVGSCPAVAALSPGPFETVATYLPGKAVSGVAARDGEVEIHVVAYYGVPLSEVAEQVRNTAAALVPEWRVNVTIDDLTVGEESGRPPEGGGRPGTPARSRG